MQETKMVGEGGLAERRWLIGKAEQKEGEACRRRRGERIFCEWGISGGGGG